jgi:hypothetical protein
MNAPEAYVNIAPTFTEDGEVLDENTARFPATTWTNGVQQALPPFCRCGRRRWLRPHVSDATDITTLAPLPLRAAAQLPRRMWTGCGGILGARSSVNSLR